MTVQITEEIGNLLPQPVDAAAAELIVLESYRQHRISGGRAAELLKESLEDFLRRIGSLGIPYFDLTPDELKEEIESAKQLARARRF